MRDRPGALVPRFVLAWKKLGLEQSLGSRIVIYADDLVILCATAQEARQALEEIRQWCEEAGCNCTRRRQRSWTWGNPARPLTIWAIAS